MKMKTAFWTLLFAVSLFGCSQHPKKAHKHLIILIDISGSIDQSSAEEAFQAIADLSETMQRGDRITIVPITGDAQAQTAGRIIRQQASSMRQAYDSDLQNFKVRIKKSLESLRSTARARPGSKTDILGSLLLAEQEFEAEPATEIRQLAILSDFIQDGELNFKTDKRLSNNVNAKKFAHQMAIANPLDFRNMHVFLGFLISTEDAGMSNKRREAIRQFWIEYLKSCQAFPRIAVDGPGLLREAFP